MIIKSDHVDDPDEPPHIHWTDRIKLKHVWLLTGLGVAYILWAQGWPSPALESLLLKAVEVWMGALIGFGIDNVHFYFAKPSSRDPTPTNMLRRTAFIVAGMVAFSL